jgi:hypothetical protein
MLWSQYKSTTIRRSEFLHKQITRIPNIANRNSNFLTLQILEFQKKIRPKSLESKTELKFRLSELEPKIRIPNQDGKGTNDGGFGWWSKHHPKCNNFLPLRKCTGSCLTGQIKSNRDTHCEAIACCS